MHSRKIAFVLTSLRKGGAEGKAQKIINALSPHFQVEVFLFNKVVEYELAEGVKVYSLGSRFVALKDSWRQLPLILYRLLRLTRKHNLDFTYAFDYIPNLLCTINKAFGWKGKVIINQVNNSQLELNTYHPFKKEVTRWLMNRCYPFADQIIVPSKGLKKSLEEQFKMSPELIRHVPNPIDLGHILLASKEVSDHSFSAAENFIFIHVGNYGRAKNHSLLLHAFAKLEAPACELWLIGKGTDSNSLKKLIDELGIRDKVRVFGLVNNPIPFMLKANCLVLCSDYEGSPNVIVEALACKLPVIATDCDYGPRELLFTSTAPATQKALDDIEIVKHGILVPVGKISTLSRAMSHCVSNPQLMDSFAEIALDRVLPLDIEKNIKTYIDLFQ